MAARTTSPAGTVASSTKAKSRRTGSRSAASSALLASPFSSRAAARADEHFERRYRARDAHDLERFGMNLAEMRERNFRSEFQRRRPPGDETKAAPRARSALWQRRTRDRPAGDDFRPCFEQVGVLGAPAQCRPDPASAAAPAARRRGHDPILGLVAAIGLADFDSPTSAKPRFAVRWTAASRPGSRLGRMGRSSRWRWGSLFQGVLAAAEGLGRAARDERPGDRPSTSPRPASTALHDVRAAAAPSHRRAT